VRNKWSWPTIEEIKREIEREKKRRELIQQLKEAGKWAD